MSLSQILTILGLSLEALSALIFIIKGLRTYEERLRERLLTLNKIIEKEIRETSIILVLFVIGILLQIIATLVT